MEKNQAPKATTQELLDAATQELADVTARYGANSHFASDAKQQISYYRTQLAREARDAK